MASDKQKIREEIELLLDDLNATIAKLQPDDRTLMIANGTDKVLRELVAWEVSR